MRVFGDIVSQMVVVALAGTVAARLVAAVFLVPAKHLARFRVERVESAVHEFSFDGATPAPWREWKVASTAQGCENSKNR